MRIIPAIDIINGKCVRLTRGDYNAVTVYDGTPLEIARRFEDHGFRYLHLVDLDGAREKHIVNHDILEKIARKTTLAVDFGGGLKSDEDLRTAFDCGASMVTIGTTAANDPETFLEWLSLFGPEKIILGADSVNRKIMVAGWAEDTGKNVCEYIAGFRKKGVIYTTCTDISKDGMLQGPAVDLYKDILARTAVSLIASGGISSIDDIRVLNETGCEGAIVGKAIYEGKIDLKELSELC
jgi:phosphoribosylformimino-5-aminoimidazole carboxamide ribotide isomerase